MGLHQDGGQPLQGSPRLHLGPVLLKNDLVKKKNNLNTRPKCILSEFADD